MAELRVLRPPTPSGSRPDHLDACPSCGHLVRIGQRCDACDQAWPADADDSLLLPVLLALLVLVAVVVAFIWL